MCALTWLCMLSLLSLLSLANAAPRALSCLSYQEIDGSLQSDDYIDEYSASGDTSLERLPESSYTAQRVRICPADYTFCFALWRQTQNGTTQIEKQGCWKESTENETTCNQTECMSTQPTNGNNYLYYCCCSGNMCNQKMFAMKVTPMEVSERAHATIDAATLQQNKNALQTNLWLMWSILLLIACVLCALGLQVYNRNVLLKNLPEATTLDCSGPGYSSNVRNVDNINLVCMLGVGKYGTVMKGHLHDQEVAVKIYSEAHHQYFINERNIYTLPFMDCPSLLKYFGFDEHNKIDGTKEYQLVLSLAPLGCLQDWLMSNTMDFETFCGMVQSIARGLSHLHTEYRSGDKIKPCIAHRDLTSRNVLVKADRTCCIADFGFALKVFGARYEYKGEMAVAETKSISEVGTLRYMAPELLEGAVNLRDCETSLKQMDVYALGLVLWEVATRCEDLYYAPEQMPGYKAPYELELGLQPTFDQMQTLVARHKARPFFPKGWRYCNATKIIKETCEDCWDHDSEARLTSLCAEERMQELPKNWASTESSSPYRNGVLSKKNASKASKDRCVEQEQPHKMLAPPNQKLPMPSESVQTHALSAQQTAQPCSSTALFELHTQHFGGYNTCEQQGEHESAEVSSSSLKVLNHSASYPKLFNERRSLRGWHKVRALIEKKILNHEQLLNTMKVKRTCDDQCTLVNSNANANGNGNEQGNTNALLMKSTDAWEGNVNANANARMRPNNLHLDESRTQTQAQRQTQQPTIVTSSVQVHENNNEKMTTRTPLQHLHYHNNNNNNNNNKAGATLMPKESWEDCQFRRQRSLEMFREVFVGQHGGQRLKDPSQRVKTPGDVPPSVRKVRASKTLSLYDDRMMEYGKYNDI